MAAFFRTRRAGHTARASLPASSPLRVCSPLPFVFTALLIRFPLDPSSSSSVPIPPSTKYPMLPSRESPTPAVFFLRAHARTHTRRAQCVCSAPRAFPQPRAHGDTHTHMRHFFWPPPRRRCSQPHTPCRAAPAPPPRFCGVARAAVCGSRAVARCAPFPHCVPKCPPLARHF